MFEIACTGSTQKDADVALQACLADMPDTIMQRPAFIMVQHSATYASQTLRERLQAQFPDTPLHGASSCMGSLNQAAFQSDDGAGLSLFALRDDDGDYGTAFCPFDDAPLEAAKTALTDALAHAGRPGELPGLVWISSSPGFEESILAGIQTIMGHSVPVVGGSAADNTITGEWSLFDATSSGQSGVVVSVLFPSVAVGTAFHSGYTPTPSRGRVTKAKGRVVYEIDGQPARAVYASWVGASLTGLDEGEVNVLGLTSLHPIGREIGQLSGAPVHVLSHPESFGSDGSIHLFSDIAEGDDIILMAGTPDTLVNRASNVMQSAARLAELDMSALSGAILVYCAGCMLTVQDRMDDVRTSITAAMPDTPFIGAFTFGEQGQLFADTNRHGNLMISSVVFGQSS